MGICCQTAVHLVKGETLKIGLTSAKRYRPEADARLKQVCPSRADLGLFVGSRRRTHSVGNQSVEVSSKIR